MLGDLEKTSGSEAQKRKSLTMELTNEILEQGVILLTFTDLAVL